MFSLLWGAQYLPRLYDLVKLALTILAVGVLVWMVLKHQSFVLFLELPISRSRINFQNLVKVFLIFQLELAQSHVNLSLVLKHAQSQYKHNKKNWNAFTSCLRFF
jgi:hypothetical protein